MEQTIFDIISIGAVLIPTLLIIFFIPLNLYLKVNMRQALRNSTEDSHIKFLRHSPKLLRIWLRKDPEGKWALLSRFFFSYNKDNRCVHGQALFHNRKLLDIKYYPPEYKDPNGKFPILSANDEVAAEGVSVGSNIVPFPNSGDKTH